MIELKYDINMDTWDLWYEHEMVYYDPARSATGWIKPADTIEELHHMFDSQSVSIFTVA